MFNDFQANICPGCHKAVFRTEGYNFCPYCGYRLPPREDPQMTCPYCRGTGKIRKSQQDMDKIIERYSARPMVETNSLKEAYARGLMRSPRYWKERDPEVVRRVEKIFDDLYGDKDKK